MKPGALVAVMVLMAIAVCALIGCATPEPQIITRTVNVAVPTPCKPDIGPRPNLMSKDQIKAALSSALILDDKIKIITEQLLLYIGWVPVVEAGLNGCAGIK